MSCLRQTCGIGTAMLLFAAVFARPAEAQAITVAATNAELTELDGVAVAKFTIEVTNHEQSPLGNVVVVFSDGTEKQVGDVPAEGKATSDQETRTLEFAIQTHAIAVPVTLKFAYEGNPTEQQQTLILTRSAS